jgi:hypothetical protein
MKITLENTSPIVRLEVPGSVTSIPARVWEGQTEHGIFIQAVIVRIAVLAEADQTAFQRELEECPAPVPSIDAFPLRMIL